MKVHSVLQGPTPLTGTTPPSPIVASHPPAHLALSSVTSSRWKFLLNTWLTYLLSPTHSLTHSLSHSLIHSLTYSLTHLERVGENHYAVLKLTTSQWSFTIKTGLMTAEKLCWTVTMTANTYHKTIFAIFWNSKPILWQKYCTCDEAYGDEQ